MTDTAVQSDSAEPGRERVQQFETEVSKLKLSGGKVSPERLSGKLSVLAIVVGIGLVFLAWVNTRSSSSSLEIADYQAMGKLGVAITIAGTGIYIVTSLRRYLRYWLLRLIFEQRAQTDRVVEHKAKEGPPFPPPG